MRANEDIREMMKNKRVTQWETAAALGVSDMTLQRWLRFELPVSKRDAIIEAINSVASEGGE